jgi:hypothetical protein
MEIEATSTPKAIKRYVDASPKARLVFLLLILFWLSLALFLDRFSVWFPLDGTPSERLLKISDRGRIALIVTVVFYLILSGIVVFESIWTVRSRQWPPQGHPMPFRTRIKEIKHPTRVWLFAGSILAIYFAHIGLHVYSWYRSNRAIQETILLLERPQGKCTTSVPEQERRTGCFGGRER